MNTASNSLFARAAADLMARDVVLLPESMPLRKAVELLLHGQVGGAPVIDAEGRCVGVLSATDVMRLAAKRPDMTHPVAPALPVTCSFQRRFHAPDGRQLTACTLPAGVCPIQSKQSVCGKEELVCRQPNCVLMDWQMVEMEQLPGDEVRHFMTPNPVMVRATASIRAIAQLMVDAHVHRLVVVDEERRPVGIISATDVIAAVARAADRAGSAGALCQEVAESIIWPANGACKSTRRHLETVAAAAERPAD